MAYLNGEEGRLVNLAQVPLDPLQSEAANMPEAGVVEGGGSRVDKNRQQESHHKEAMRSPMG